MRSLYFTESIGASILLQGDEGHHAADVARVRVGEEIDVSDGTRLIHARVTSVSKGRVEAEILSELSVPVLKPRITIAQALIKGDAMGESIDLMTQVGVHAVIPWISERSIVHWDANKAEKNHGKLKAIAFEASKQSRRPTLPHLSQLQSAAELKATFDQFDRVITLHESGVDHLADEKVMVESLLMIVGPEGGLSNNELNFFDTDIRRIGPTVIRSAQAGAVAAAVVFAGSAWRK